MEKKTILESVAGLVGTLFASMLPVPDLLTRLAFAACAFWAFDTLTGPWASKRKGLEVKSREFREGMSRKAFSYLSILFFGFILGVLSRSWYPFEGAMVALILSEGLSILENVDTVLQSYDAKSPLVIVVRQFTSRARKLLTSATEQLVPNAEGDHTFTKNDDERLPNDTSTAPVAQQKQV
jgi:hypothetical protein